jgi:hypothetical protein
MLYVGCIRTDSILASAAYFCAKGFPSGAGTRTRLPSANQIGSRSSDRTVPSLLEGDRQLGGLHL